jgi:hypothetical protein
VFYLYMEALRKMTTRAIVVRPVAGASSP